MSFHLHIPKNSTIFAAAMRKSVQILFAAWLLLTVTSCRPDAADAIRRMQAQCPDIALQDIYKSFYQDRFGAGHMLTDTAAVRAWLISELQTAAIDTVLNPYFEPTGAKGRFVRVYLRCVNEGLISADLLFDAFARSAVPVPQSEPAWSDEWQSLMEAAQKAGVPCPEDDCQQLMHAANLGAAVHHSDAYRNACHPHYRIVERTIFDKEIRPFLPE